MFEQQLIIVSGKGGVGRTTVASAVAGSCARAHRTVLVNFAAGSDTHPVFNVPLTYEPVRVAERLDVMRVDAMAAIREYVRRRIPFAGLYEAFLKTRMFRDFADAAPGFQELMCLGKLYDLVTESGYEKVVFDAPATGHFRTLVDVPAATLKTVLVGPVNHSARRIQDLLVDPERTRVVLVTLAEELPVREAMELETFCRERRVQVGPLIVNQTVPDRFTHAEVEALSGLLEVANRHGGPPSSPSGLENAVRCALAEHEQAMSQAEALEPIAGGRPLWQVGRCVDHEPDVVLTSVRRDLERAVSGGG